MAPGEVLRIPKLSAQALDPFRPSSGEGKGLVLARTLIETGIGCPENWQTAKSDPIQFMLKTVQQRTKRFDRRLIDPVADISVGLGTNPVHSSWREPEQDPTQVFLTVEANHISVVYLQRTLDLLGEVNERLPATFYRMLMSAVAGRILCYDEAEAARYFEYRMEEYAELEQAGETGLEKPQTVEEAKGRWLAPEFQPLQRVELAKIIETLRRPSRARRIMDAAQGLLAVSRRRKRYRPDWSILGDYTSNEFFTLPFTILAFHVQDIVCQAFESDEQGWMNGGDEPGPAFFAVMRPDEPRSVQQAFRHLDNFLSVLEAFGRLLALLPGCDLLKLEEE